MKRYCLALDLIDNPALIAEYERLHRRDNGWPEIAKSIVDAGIVNMEIYRTGNRLFMVIEADESFSFEKKAHMDGSNAKVQEWEQLMWSFQQPLPWSGEGEKWVSMQRIFELDKNIE